MIQKDLHSFLQEVLVLFTINETCPVFNWGDVCHINVYYIPGKRRHTKKRGWIEGKMVNLLNEVMKRVWDPELWSGGSTCLGSFWGNKNTGLTSIL